MKKYAKYVITIAILTLLIIAAGHATNRFYFYMNTDRPSIYPGDKIKLNISANARTDSVKDIHKKYSIDIFKLSKDELSANYKKILKNKRAFKTIKGTFTLKYKNNDWRYVHKTIKLPKLKAGHYVIRAECDQKTRYRYVNITRIGVIVKTDSKKMLIFAQDKKTGNPLPAKLRIFNPVNKTAYNTKAGSDGTKIVYYKDIEGMDVSVNPRVEATYKGQSAATYTYNYAKRSRLRGYIYTDRPIYRPGQKVFIKAVLRMEKDGAFNMPRNEKVKITIKDPKWTEIKKEEVKTDQFGNINTALNLGSEAALGNYYVYVNLKGQNASARFKVEEYRKPEFEIIVNPEKKFYVQGDTIKADVLAKYYFGAPVPDTEFTYEVRRNYFYPYYRSRRFTWWQRQYVPSPYYGGVVTSGKGKTDKNGKAKISFSAKKWNHDASYTIIVRMVDKSRRQVNGSGRVMVTRGRFYLHVKTNKYFHQVGERVEVNVKAADYQDNPVKTNFTLKVKRTVYKQGKSKDHGVFTKQLSTDKNGVSRYHFTPSKPGYYRLKVEALDKKENKITASRSFHCTAGGYTSWYNFSNLQIMPDKKFYKPGDTAKILIANPYPGSTALIAVEGAQIFQHQVQNFKGNSKVLNVRIKKNHAPNIYVTATFFHKNRYYSTSKRIMVIDSENFIKVEIKTDKPKYEPRQTASFKIITLDHNGKPVSTQVTMGVTDESIYALSPDTTPNIQKFFYGSRANRVYTRSSYYAYHPVAAGRAKNEKSLDDESRAEEPKAPAPAKSKSARKEMDKSGLAGMKQPEFIREYFPDTCYFNSNIITDHKGAAKVNVVLPDSLTTWRATARGVTADTKVGQATKKVIVTKDVLVRLITPRFLTERDEVVISGIVHNYLERKKKVRAVLMADGVKMLEKSAKTAIIGPNGSKRFDWKVKADKTGTAKFTLKGLTNEKSDAMMLKIPVLPHGTEKYDSQAGDTTDGKTITLTLPKQSSKNSAMMRIQVSPSIASTMFPALKYLIGYPYGCVEQTMSRFLPSVIVAKTLRQMDIYDEDINKKLPKMVQKGLNRLYNFQHSDGGWGWWKHDKSHPYMTAYVIYGLSKAKNAGYNVRQNVINRGKSWLEKNFQKAETINTKAYILFALSEAGFKKPAWASDLYNRRHKMDSYSKAILALTLQKHGMTDRAMTMANLIEKEADVTGVLCTWKGKTNKYGWTDNQVETSAYCLLALVKIKPQSGLIGKAVRYLAISRIGNRWYSTKDTAAAVMALTEFLKISPEMNPDYSATVALNGKVIKQLTFTQKDVGGKGMTVKIPADKIKRGNNRLTFTKKGKGKLYFSAYLRYYSKEENIKASSAGFQVRREYFLINKNVKKNAPNHLIPLKGQKVKLYSQDLILVRITITGNRGYEYVIVEDPKPAGCEVADHLQGAHGTWRYWYARREVRDEKTAFFITRYYKGVRKIEYKLRAETPGNFHTMPTKVSLMYIPEIGGISDEMQFHIVERTKKTAKAEKARWEKLIEKAEAIRKAMFPFSAMGAGGFSAVAGLNH